MDVNAGAYFKKIIARRDPRFDGRFYFGVKTTGIYCRPICPAKPKPENIVIFRSPSEAERAGYRACLRCHPDLAPGMKRVNPAAQRVAQALRIIQTHPQDNLTIETLSAALGVTARHLRRLFEDHLGASPIEIMVTQRLHAAKQMIQETSAPMTEIAFAAGFQSIRRFNEAFKACYRTAPSAFRKKGALGASGSLALKIPLRPPYDWESVLAYLKRHETYGLERVEGNRYRRYVPRHNAFGVITISYVAGNDHLNAEFLNVPLGDVRGLLARVKNLFDTDHNPLHLPRFGQGAVKGLRVPGSFDPFETAVSILLSQLVSGEHARQALKKVVLRYGRKIGVHEGRDVYAFPAAQTLARATLKTIGLPAPRAQAIRALARGIAKGTIDFTAHGGLAEMKERLLRIHGIGPWTVAMLSMRCLNDVDAFPEFDLVVRRALQKKWINPAAWTSARAYLTHHIWQNFAVAKGALK